MTNRDAPNGGKSPWLANPQQWALDAGLPEPEDGEPWIPYLFRLGLLDIDIENLMEDLTDQTSDLMTYRFTEYLRQHGFNEQWWAHAERRRHLLLRH